MLPPEFRLPTSWRQLLRQSFTQFEHSVRVKKETGGKLWASLLPEISLDKKTLKTRIGPSHILHFVLVSTYAYRLK